MSYINFTSIADAPALDCVEITPGPSPLPAPIRAIVAATAGTITVTTFRGNSRTIPVAAALPVPIVCTHVTAATATGIVGFY